MSHVTLIEPVVADNVAHRLKLGLVTAAPVQIGPAGTSLEEDIASTCRALREHYGNAEPADIIGLKTARELYHAFGIDPTRTRPSSEALLRRIVRGKPFPRINNAVDWGNLVAVKTLLPLGLYDTNKLRGTVLLREGDPGEAYPGIRKETVHLEGRPTLVDGDGPFGNPTSDSLRTSVDDSCTALTLVLFAPPSVTTAVLTEHVQMIARGMAEHLGGMQGPVVTATKVWATTRS